MSRAAFTSAEMWVIGIAITLVSIVISAWLASLTLKTAAPTPVRSDRWLQPCPFCGSVSVVRTRDSARRGHVYLASCDSADCFFLGPETADVHAAISAWNRIEVAN